MGRALFRAPAARRQRRGDINPQRAWRRRAATEELKRLREKVGLGEGKPPPAAGQARRQRRAAGRIRACPRGELPDRPGKPARPGERPRVMVKDAEATPCAWTTTRGRPAWRRPGSRSSNTAATTLKPAAAPRRAPDTHRVLVQMPRTYLQRVGSGIFCATQYRPTPRATNPCAPVDSACHVKETRPTPRSSATNSWSGRVIRKLAAGLYNLAAPRCVCYARSSDRARGDGPCRGPGGLDARCSPRALAGVRALGLLRVGAASASRPPRA